MDFFVSDMGKFWLVIGNFFLTWKFLLDMRFWLEQNFLDMGEFFFLLGMEFWLEQIFGQGKIFCKAWDFFFFGSEYFGMSILGWIFCGHLDDWPTLFCKTSRVEVASKCWKAHGRYCLQTLRTSSMKQASRISSKLYWIMIPMSTRISNYSLLCQSDLRHYLHFQFSRH